MSQHGFHLTRLLSSFRWRNWPGAWTLMLTEGSTSKISATACSPLKVRCFISRHQKWDHSLFPLYKVIWTNPTFRAKVLLLFISNSVCEVCFWKSGTFLCLTVFSLLVVESFYLFCISLRLRGDAEDGSGPLQCCLHQGICDWQRLPIPGTLVRLSPRRQKAKRRLTSSISGFYTLLFWIANITLLWRCTLS